VIIEGKKFGDTTYALISCCGCSEISMARSYLHGGFSYYPSPVSREEPEWVSYKRFEAAVSKDVNEKEKVLWDLIDEIYKSVHGGQNRLAAMGIRALLEQVMILTVGDQGSFNDNLDEFQKKGFISFVQRDSMRATLDVGDAATHRGFKPSNADLCLALDVVEGVLAPIFHQRQATDVLIDQLPKRPPRKK
jgi:Domain of unknown function (DUF4145)